MANTYRIYAVGTTAGLIDQCKSNNIDFGNKEIMESGDGAVDPLFAALIEQLSSITFQTTAIKTALTAAGISGLAQAGNCDLYLVRNTDGATIDGATSHRRIRISRSLLVPRTLDAKQGEPAALTMEILPTTTDGMTNPIVHTASQSLAGSPTVDEIFTLGPASINGTALALIQSLSVDFGIKVDRKMGDGGPFPKFASIISRLPKIKVDGLDHVILDTTNVAGAKQGATASTFYLRRMEQGLTVYANNASQHLKFTVAAGRHYLGGIQGTHDGDSTHDLNSMPTFDGTNAIVAIGTDQTIS